MSSTNTLQYYPDFITELEEQELLDYINKQSWDTTLKRRTQHYGWRYPYRLKNELEKTTDIPEEIKPYLEKINKLFNKNLDQLIINEYQPGQGITPHIDSTDVFGDTIVSVSLGSSCVMKFESEDDRFEKILERRSLICLQDKYRNRYLHSIPARKNDYINNKKVERQIRISLTFRKKV